MNPLTRIRAWRRPSGASLRADASAGLVLGVESVPDGLASGLLAGVNPLSGLYGYLFGMVGAAAVTSSTLMAVQSTGAMALVVADTDLLAAEDPERALFTLSVLTGAVMIAAGFSRAATLLRFVPSAVMTGFVSGIGVNIVLGQLANFTGYDAPGENRVMRSLNLLLHPMRADPATLLVGTATIVAIVLLGRTPLRSLGLVVAVVAGSVLSACLAAAGHDILLVSSLAEVPRALPGPVLPVPGEALGLLLPALSLAFVGLVQGAAVSVGVPNPDGSATDASRDFVGQGAGNVVSGLFQGMPVGGSMSASALVHSGGARSRISLFIAGAVMAVVILVLGGAVGYVAMPALAALLIVVGISTVRPAQVQSVIRTGPLQSAVMAVTFALTLLTPLQYAVLAGVGLAVILYVAEQSNNLTLRAIEFNQSGRIREVDPPDFVPGHSVVVIQPYGHLFFASAPVLAAQLPAVREGSVGSVVILRLRGVDHLGLAMIDVLGRYASDLQEHGCTLKLVVGSDVVHRQMESEGLIELVGEPHVYRGNQWLGETVRRAYADAEIQIQDGTPGEARP
ncbi:MAG: hypothetical protein L0H93_03245 [Nocardioides sp.]|nr:hypothetical protein [Nocardioides sp.]